MARENASAQHSKHSADSKTNSAQASNQQKQISTREQNRRKRRDFIREQGPDLPILSEEELYGSKNEQEPVSSKDKHTDSKKTDKKNKKESTSKKKDAVAKAKHGKHVAVKDAKTDSTAQARNTPASIKPEPLPKKSVDLEVDKNTQKVESVSKPTIEKAQKAEVVSKPEAKQLLEQAAPSASKTRVSKPANKNQQQKTSFQPAVSMAPSVAFAQEQQPMSQIEPVEKKKTPQPEPKKADTDFSHFSRNSYKVDRSSYSSDSFRQPAPPRNTSFKIPQQPEELLEYVSADALSQSVTAPAQSQEFAGDQPRSFDNQNATVAFQPQVFPGYQPSSPANQDFTRAFQSQNAQAGYQPNQVITEPYQSTPQTAQASQNGRLVERDSGVPVWRDESGREIELKRPRRVPLPVKVILILIIVLIIGAAAIFVVKPSFAQPFITQITQAFGIATNDTSSDNNSSNAAVSDTSLDSITNSSTKLIAECEGTKIYSPILTKDITGILFHQASYKWALPVTTELPDAPEDVYSGTAKLTVNHNQVEGDWVDANALHIYRAGLTTPINTAIDVGADAGTEVRAPVTGTVIAVIDYDLYDKTPDVQIHIRPDSNSTQDVVLLHQCDPKVKVGDRVEGGKTVISVTRDISAVLSDIQLDYYVEDGKTGNHSHMCVNDLTDTDYLNTYFNGVAPTV